jgi:uncharacterized low-complexity protein
MNKLSALALALSLGFATMGAGTADAAMMAKHHHHVSHHMVCHSWKGKSGKMHKKCHIEHRITHHMHQHHDMHKKGGKKY